MTAGRDGLDFIVDKKDWAKSRLVPSTIPRELASGQVLFRVDRFAFTSNNISYASAGDMLKYWDFFPVEPAGAGLGRIPAMGFGDVIASAHDDVAEGTRCFGFFPMSRALVIEPESVTAATITDGAPHRAPTALVYRQYNLTTADATYDASFEDEIMLLRGLFMTSFLAEDFLQEAGLYGAEQIIVSSASSKTSIALAQVASTRGVARVVGLTSDRNRTFVEGLGFYDEVLGYDELERLDAARAAVFVDMAGSAAVTRGVHERMGDALKYSMQIGNTHWDEGGAVDVPGVAPEFFFAPARIAKRLEDWGPGGLQERMGAALRGFLATTSSWLTVERGYGGDAVDRVYHETLAGRSDPSIGHVLSLWDDEAQASGAQ
jgi:hypothetical protein